MSQSAFPWLFLSYMVRGMTDDLPTPCHPIHLLARSLSSTFHVLLASVFPSCFRSFSLPFPWCIHSQHFPQYVFFIAPHHMPVPIQSSLRDLFGSLCHSRCSLHFFFLILSLRVTLHIHCSIITSIRFSCHFVVHHVSAPCIITIISKICS